MDIATLDHICRLSKLNFTEEEQQKALAEMSDIIAPGCCSSTCG